MSAPQGIELEIELMDDLDKKFTTLPNALLRGEADDALGLDFRGYTLRERCMLAALYGMKTGYRCSRDRVDRLAPELGRDAVDTVLRGLKKRGNLRTIRENDPQHRGKFIWRWQVSLKPLETAGQSIPGSSGDGEKAEVATIPGLAVHGSSTLGSSTRGSSGSYKEEELLSSRRTKNSLSGADASAAAAPVADPREREIPAQRADPKSSPTGPAVEELVAEALAVKPTWSKTETRKAIKAELADGRPLELVTKAWRLFLADPLTRSPGRFKHAQDWWKDAYRSGPDVPPALQPPAPIPSAADCDQCDDHGWLLTDDPIGPAARCTHAAMATAV